LLYRMNHCTFLTSFVWSYQQRQIHHMMSGSHLASQKMHYFYKQNICTICHLFGAYACSHKMCHRTNFQSESFWVSRDWKVMFFFVFGEHMAKKKHWNPSKKSNACIIFKANPPKTHMLWTCLRNKQLAKKLLKTHTHTHTQLLLQSITFCSFF
jgi:hypothetical protein